MPDMAPRHAKRPMAERRELWRSYAAKDPCDWDLAYSWLRAELADLERACQDSFVLRVRTAWPRHRVRKLATSAFIRLCQQITEARSLRGYEARAAEFAAARTDDERLWTARGWLTWCESRTPLRTADRASLSGMLAFLCERVASLRGNH